MARISRLDIESALQRLGELAQPDEIHLVIVGGAAMVLGYGERESTHDVDAVVIDGVASSRVRDLVEKIARERGWEPSWLNDGAKSFLHGFALGPELFRSPGIVVWQPSSLQLLAMKLSAWRDDVDIADATRLLRESGLTDSREACWEGIKPFVISGYELKAYYALSDLWESMYGDHR